MNNANLNIFSSSIITTNITSVNNTIIYMVIIFYGDIGLSTHHQKVKEMMLLLQLFENF
jgi:hypothetical protein